MIEEVLNSGEICRLDLYGKYELPPWTITHYCHQTLINSLKMTTIINILKLFDAGKQSHDFLIEIKPKELYPEYDDLLKKAKKVVKYSEIENKPNEIVYLFSKDTSPYDFWRLLKRQDRPNVLVRDENMWVPIYDQDYRTSIQLRSISVNSPPSFSFEGLGQTINDLRFGKDQENRNHINWQNEQIQNISNNVDNIVRNSATMNDPDVPEGIKAYASEIYSSLMHKQAELNDKIGLDRIELRSIDIKT